MKTRGWTDGASELYDEANDPEETQNLAADARHKETIRSLQALLNEVGSFRPAPSGPSATTSRKVKGP